MRFLLRLLKVSGERSSAVERIGLEAISHEAVLSNYLTSKSYIRGNAVHSSAFLPRKGELSLFQTQGLNETAVWNIGAQHVLRPGRHLYGRADNAPKAYYSAGLELVADNRPERHVNAVGWPAEDAKDAQKEIALLIATAARLVLCTPPIAR